MIAAPRLRWWQRLALAIVGVDPVAAIVATFVGFVVACVCWGLL